MNVNEVSATNVATLVAAATLILPTALTVLAIVIIAMFSVLIGPGRRADHAHRVMEFLRALVRELRAS